MKKRIGFYFDASKLGYWNWKSFLDGDIGMSGTDGQLMLLVNDMSNIYDVYFFTNVDDKDHVNFTTLKVRSLTEVATKAVELKLDLLIFNNRGDDETIAGMKELEKVKQPFLLWDQNGPAAAIEEQLTNYHSLKRVVCVSNAQANWARHRKYFHKVAYIHNGRDYDTSNFKKAAIADTLNIGYIGAVGESKGFHWLAKAWPKVKEALPNATLTVIGSIKTHDRTRKTGDLLIAEPDFEDTFIKPYLGKDLEEIKNNGITFTGHITPNEIPKHMGYLQLGIVNTNIDNAIETFCVSAIDFQAYGVPVIGGNAGGLKETVNNGNTGVLIDKTDQLADAIIDLLSNKDKLNRYSHNCAQWVTMNFSRKKVIADWKNLIEDVLAGKDNKIVKLDLKSLDVKLLAKEAIRIKNNLFKSS